MAYLVSNKELHRYSNPSRRSRKRWNNWWMGNPMASRPVRYWGAFRCAERSGGRQRDIREFSRSMEHDGIEQT